MTSNEWGAQIIFWLVNAAINSVVLWVVINRILGSPGEAGFMKCAGCSLLVSILGGLGMRIGVFIGAIVGTFVGIFLAFISPTAGLIAGVVLGLGIAIFWWWRFAH
ncbi:hypothetical protein HYR69_01745 [Candidatus Sumerlaeota bacterium]|nr:hypothetical protein [Candidatus Sumerlaeota bacterium]